MNWVAALFVSTFVMAQISTDIFEESQTKSKGDTFKDTVRIIRAFDEGWDISFVTRKGVFQAEKGKFDDLLKESFEEQTPLEIEVDSNTNQILAVKRQKTQKSKSSGF
jgi:hypothetical protein